MVVQFGDFQIIEHGIPVFNDQEILQMDEFTVKLCCDFFHSDECNGLWNKTRSTGTSKGKGTYTVHASLYIWDILQELYVKGRIFNSNYNRDNELTKRDNDRDNI